MGAQGMRAPLFGMQGTTGRGVRRGRRPSAWAGVLSVVASAGVVLLPSAPAQATEEVYPRPADGVWAVQGRGYGHGRGMSQWGAQGAATLGVTAGQILSTYYPKTLPATLTTKPIRVLVTGDLDGDTEVRAAPGLTVTDGAAGTPMTLSTGPTRWRAALGTDGLLHLSSLTGSTWTSETIGAKAAFVGPLRFDGSSRVRLDLADGTSRDYRGAVQAVRLSATQSESVAVLPLDDYLLGVVPQEAYPSWKPAALQAQAVAARSYGAYQRDHAGLRNYDICDSTSCQVFRGSTVYDASGTPAPQEDSRTTAAVTATAGQVRTYAGAIIFAEFSSSNGGWSAAGDARFPYLVARQDDWDGVAPNNVHSWGATLTAASLEARYPAVGHLLRLRVTARDGHGEWGGRVTTVVLEGVDSHGADTSVTTTGSGVAAARPLSRAYPDGLRSSWWHLSPAHDATVASWGAAPRLVRPPGQTTGSLTVTMVNAGASPWPVADLRLATSTASGNGAEQKLTGTSSTPGRFVADLTRPGATSVLPGERAAFQVPLDATGLPAGSYAASYRVQLGTAPAFGAVAAWTVALVEPTWTARPGAAPVLVAGQSSPSALLGSTVVLARSGSTTVTLSARNTSNITWPVGSTSPVQLGTSQPRGRTSASKAGGWPTADRAAHLAASAPVAPGSAGSFALRLGGNGLPAGVTHEAFEPEWVGRTWISGDLTALTVVRTDPAVSRLASLELAPTASFSLVNAPTGTRTLVLRLRNLGGASWPVGSEGLQASAPSVLATSAWPSSSRPPALAANASRPGQSSVRPGEVGEWRVPVSGLHATPGTVRLSLRATSGGHAYGPAMTVTVTVVAARFTAAIVAVHAMVSVPSRGAATTSYDVKNTGNVVWVVRGTLRSTVRAGSSPSRASSWLSASRPGPLTASVTRPGATVVRPGEVGRFVVVLAGNRRTPRMTSEVFGLSWDGWRPTSLSAVLAYRVV